MIERLSIALRGVRVRRGTLRVLRDLSMDLQAGEPWVLV